MEFFFICGIMLLYPMYGISRMIRKQMPSGIIRLVTSITAISSWFVCVSGYHPEKSSIQVFMEQLKNGDLLAYVAMLMMVLWLFLCIQDLAWLYKYIKKRTQGVKI